MKAVILAGGRGTRLKPYTNVFPKPLMPIGDKPILEIILQQLKLENCGEVILTVGHLQELITNFFGDGAKYGLKLTYSKEDQPLGTAGPLTLLGDQLKETFLMLNGDILTTLSFSHLVDFHRRSNAVATVALNKRDTYVDFGVVELDSLGNLAGYTEKPTLNYLVSMGVYVFEPRVIGYLTHGQKQDFPDLVKKLLASGETVKGYIFDGYWLDIGRAEDYERANSEFAAVFSGNGI